MPLVLFYLAGAIALVTLAIHLRSFLPHWHLRPTLDESVLTAAADSVLSKLKDLAPPSSQPAITPGT